jgi:hypothetical protein
MIVVSQHAEALHVAIVAMLGKDSAELPELLARSLRAVEGQATDELVTLRERQRQIDATIASAKDPSSPVSIEATIMVWQERAWDAETEVKSLRDQLTVAKEKLSSIAREASNYFKDHA